MTIIFFAAAKRFSPLYCTYNFSKGLGTLQAKLGKASTLLHWSSSWVELILEFWEKLFEFIVKR